jgi:hypothetical protein
VRLAPWSEEIHLLISQRQLGACSQFWSHSPMFNDVHGAPGRTARRGRRPYRPGVNGQPQTWKACWEQPLKGGGEQGSGVFRDCPFVS